MAAVRASDSATPGPSFSSSSGSTSTRVRDLANDGSALLGSCQGSRPSTSQIARVSARRSPRNGRSRRSRAGRIPARERVPEPRASPSRTCSAWSSRVWPSRIAPAPASSAAASRAAWRASRAAASGPMPVEATSTVLICTGESPSSRSADRGGGRRRRRNRAAAGGPPRRRRRRRGGRPRARGGRSTRRRRRAPASRALRCRPPGPVPGSPPRPARPAAFSARCRRRARAGRAGDVRWTEACPLETGLEVTGTSAPSARARAWNRGFRPRSAGGPRTPRPC